MAPAMPCKRDKRHSSIVKTNGEQKNGLEKELKTKLWLYGGIPTSLRDREQNLPKDMKTTLQAKDLLRLSRYNLVHKFILVPQAMKIPDAKAAVDKGKRKETNMRVFFASLMDKCHLGIANLEPKLQKSQGRVLLRETLKRTILEPTGHIRLGLRVLGFGFWVLGLGLGAWGLGLRA